MRKLLFLTPELPYPPQSGGKLKSMKLVDALAENFDVTLVSPLKLDDAAHRAAFASRSPCGEHVHREIDIPRSAKSLANSYFARKPWIENAESARLAREARKAGHRPPPI